VNIYAATYYASKDNGSYISTAYTTNVILADTEEIARKIAWDECQKTFPEREGYSTHQYSLCLALPETIVSYNGKKTKYTITITAEEIS
jgi:hypothetical protein